MSAPSSTAEPAGDAARVFAALGDPVRLALVDRLSGERPVSIAALSAQATISRQAITKHLHVLERAGLVTRERSGREARYALRSEPVAAASAYLDAIGRRWEQALGRLRAYVEPD